LTLKKIDIARKISRKSEIAQPQALKYIDCALRIIKEELGEGGDVKVEGFGKWHTKDKRGRPGRVVKTGEEVWIKPRRVVRFSPSKKMIDAVNSKDD